VSPVYEQERGKTSVWWYIGGGCCGCIILYILVSAIFGVVMFRGMSTGRGFGGKMMSQGMNMACTTNLQQISVAMQTYAADNKGYLPPADRWVDALKAKGTDPDVFMCVEIKPGMNMNAPPVRHYFAMNSKYGGKKLEDVRKLGDVPLVYESTATVANANDPETSLPSPGRHQGKNNVLYPSGAVVQK
jgi:hypothetical protein